MNLELMAMRWLRFEKRQVLVLKERSPRMLICGRPDVIGVSASRHLTEIEIKRSLADFRADQHKDSRRFRIANSDQFPMYFYYMVPIEISEKVEPMLPEWAGLIHGHYSGFCAVVRQAPKNRDAKRLTVKECLRLVIMLGNQIISSETSRESIMGQHRFGHEPYWHCDYEI